MPTSDLSNSLALPPVPGTPQPCQSDNRLLAPGSHPILTIPTEITAQIFAHCLPSSPSRPKIDRAPLILGRICRNWRNFALDSPELWASLQIDRAGIPVDLVEIWLSRARNFPLTLVLRVSVSHNNWDPEPYINILQRHAQTWRDVTLEVAFEKLFLLSADLHLPMLERLAIVSYGTNEEGLPVNAFRTAPALRHLQLDAGIHPASIPLPWVQLTSFESRAGVLRPEALLTIMQHTPNIVHCKVAIDDDTEVDRFPDVPPLMFLTTLTLGTFIPEVMSVLEHLSLPALRVLDVWGLFSGSELLPPLHRFLSKSRCQLRALAIRISRNAPPREEDLIQLLETQPALEKFNLREGSLDLLIAICRRLSDGSSFLPRLGNLTASTHNYSVNELTATFPAMLDAIVDALSTRWVAPPESFAPIRNCTLFWSRSRTANLDSIVASFRPRQKELAALGIKMHVRKRS
ncbi:hypothetical protein FB451DRAFT_1564453 [Mycena latifolia]|nr:hypothetical protein FB451DRAFT_1564453 [Mycena latifolia]